MQTSSHGGERRLRLHPRWHDVSEKDYSPPTKSRQHSRQRTRSRRVGTKLFLPSPYVELPNACFALIPCALPTVYNWRRHCSRLITILSRWNLFAWTLVSQA